VVLTCHQRLWSYGLTALYKSDYYYYCTWLSLDCLHFWFYHLTRSELWKLKYSVGIASWCISGWDMLLCKAKSVLKRLDLSAAQRISRESSESHSEIRDSCKETAVRRLPRQILGLATGILLGRSQLNWQPHPSVEWMKSHFIWTNLVKTLLVFHNSILPSVG